MGILSSEESERQKISYWSLWKKLREWLAALFLPEIHSRRAFYNTDD
jgi:hypothetical protein